MNGCHHEHFCIECSKPFNCWNPECISVRNWLCGKCYHKTVQAFNNVVEMHRQKMPERTFSASYAKGSPPDETDGKDPTEAS